MSAKELATATFDYSKVELETKGKLTNLAGQIRRGKGNYVKSVMELGEAIHTAHDLLAGKGGEGQFSQWVEVECNIERRTAYNYMHAFERFGKCENISHFAPSAMYSLSAPEAPKQAAKEAEKLAGKGEKITIAKAKEILDRFREVEKPKPKPPPPAPTASAQPAVEADQPAEPNECAPGKHKWNDEGDCEKCHVSKAVAEPKGKPGKVSGGTAFNVEELEPSDVRDGLGKEPPKELREVFGKLEEFDAQRNTLTQIKKWFNVIRRHAAGALIEKGYQRLTTDLDNLDSEIKFARPHTVCPYCKNKNPKVIHCEACKGAGWVSKEIYEACPKDMKHAG